MLNLLSATVESASAGTPSHLSPSVTPRVSAFILDIVILDDNIARRDGLSNAITAAGCHVKTPDFVEEIYEMSSSWRFDIAVIDVDLSGEKGLALAARLRTICPDLGLVMLTSPDQLIERCQAYASGVDICLDQSVDVGKLLSVINSLARRLKQAQPREVTSGLVLDTALETLANTGQSLEVALTTGEMHIVQNLALAPEQRLANWQLIEIMHHQFDIRGKKNLEVAISRIRAKLRLQGLLLPIILTERGFGYRLCVSLTLI